MRTAAGVSEPRAFSGREIRLKVHPMCHNDDILFATLDCENDEKHYHHYPNWGTQNGDLEKIKIAPKLTWNFSFSGLKVQASLSPWADRWERFYIDLIYPGLFNDFSKGSHITKSVLILRAFLPFSNVNACTNI